MTTTAPLFIDDLPALMTKVKGYVPEPPKKHEPLTFWQWINTRRDILWVNAAFMAFALLCLAVWLVRGGSWIYLTFATGGALILILLIDLDSWLRARSKDAGSHRYSAEAYVLRTEVRSVLLAAHRREAPACQALLAHTDGAADDRNWIYNYLLTDFMRSAASLLRERIKTEQHFEELKAKAKIKARELTKEALELRRQIKSKQRAAERTPSGFSGFRIRQEWIKLAEPLKMLVENANRFGDANTSLSEYLPEDWPTLAQAQAAITEARQSLIDFVADCVRAVRVPASSPEHHYRELKALEGWCREAVGLYRDHHQTDANLTLPTDWNNVVARALQNPDPALYWLPAAGSVELTRFVALVVSNVRADRHETETREGHYVAMAVLALAIMQRSPELRSLMGAGTEALLWDYIVSRGNYPGSGLQRLVWAAALGAPSGA